MSTAPTAQAPSNHSIEASAMRVHAFGGPEAMIFEPIALSPPGEGEILVRVRAAGVGPWDTWVRSGKSVLPQPLPLTPGSDVSGIVERVGSGVENFAVGDAVYGTTNTQFTNGYATRAICTAAMMARKPASLSFIEAAGIPVVAVTAWQMLFDHAKVRDGQTVLVLGAAGSVGAFAVQLAHAAGVRVVASARPDGTRFLETLGADVVIGPLDDPATPPPRGIDAVIDLVGGQAQRIAMDALKPQGVLISAVSQPDAAAGGNLRIEARFILVNVNTEQLTQIADRFDAGALRAKVGRVLPLDQAVKAHEMIEGRIPHAPGKIVLQVG
jgi:NADPH:quinone reductase-like Zn-dependent oxidoreductase